MRLRRSDLRTGRMLTAFDATDRARNRSLLFLVGDVDGAAALEPIRQSCERVLERAGLTGCEWFDVLDQADLAAVETRLNTSRITHIEAAELAGLDQPVLDGLLEPPLRALACGSDEPLFPSASASGGFPVEGVQLLDRRQELADLTAFLVAGDDVLLQAPRRSGKTSLLRRLARDLGERFQTAYWDLERHETPEDDVAALWARLSPAESFRTARARARKDWPGLLRQAFETLVGQARQGGRRGVVVLVDELVYLLRYLRRRQSEKAGVEKAAGLLTGLTAALEGLPIQLVVAGSETLGAELRDLGLDAERVPHRLRAAKCYSLPPMSPDDTALEMRRLLLGTGILATKEDLDWLLDHLDLALPYPAMQFLDKLAGGLGRREIGPVADLDATLATFLDSSDAFADLERHLYSKGKEIPGAEKAIETALDLLTAAEAEIGAAVGDVRAKLEHHAPGKGEPLLAWLLETFPLRRQDDRVLVMAKLFRAWWRRQARAGV
jgi:hypothetical protein